MKTKAEKLAPFYTYRVQWSEEDKTFLAKCLEFPSLSTHGKTKGIAISEIEKVVKKSLIWMLEEGEEIPESLGKKKFKGQYPLRMTPETHRELSIKAAEQEVSLNQYIQSKLG